MSNWGLKRLGKLFEIKENFIVGVEKIFWLNRLINLIN